MPLRETPLTRYYAIVAVVALLFLAGYGIYSLVEWVIETVGGWL